VQRRQSRIVRLQAFDLEVGGGIAGFRGSRGRCVRLGVAHDVTYRALFDDRIVPCAVRETHYRLAPISIATGYRVCRGNAAAGRCRTALMMIAGNTEIVWQQCDAADSRSEVAI
jgi:hypothetical protein